MGHPYRHVTVFERPLVYGGRITPGSTLDTSCELEPDGADTTLCVSKVAVGRMSADGLASIRSVGDRTRVAPALRALVEGMTERNPRILAAGMAPTPYTADEIRGGCPIGRVIVVATEQPDAPTTHREIRFVGADAHTATQRFTAIDGDGMALAASEIRTTSWSELQAHASFSADVTSISREVVVTPLGELDCLRYERVTDDATDTFWFATDLPGMPVRFTRHERGRLVRATTITSNRFEPDGFARLEPGSPLDR